MKEGDIYFYKQRIVRIITTKDNRVSFHVLTDECFNLIKQKRDVSLDYFEAYSTPLTQEFFDSLIKTAIQQLINLSIVNKHLKI